jgi:hypothetical protein
VIRKGAKGQCRECGRYFSSDTAFDGHRIGKHGKDRRCMTAIDMLRLGMRFISGVWRGQEMPSAFLGRFAK